MLHPWGLHHKSLGKRIAKLNSAVIQDEPGAKSQQTWSHAGLAVSACCARYVGRTEIE